jgi:hypothetical protein
VAAATLEQLHEPAEVEAGRGSNDDVNVRPEDGDLDELRAFSNRGAFDELIQKIPSRSIDHGSTIMGAPGQVEEKAVSGHDAIGQDAERESTDGQHPRGEAQCSWGSGFQPVDSGGG